MRRKQTSIRFSRSALPHRYLRYISWISWNSHRPQPSISWVFPPRAATAHRFSRRRLYPKAAVAALLLLLPPGGQSKYSSDLFSRKRETSISPFPAQLSRAAPPASLLPRCSVSCPSHVPPSAAGLSPAPHVAFCGPPINKKCGPAALRREPAQKSVDFSLKKAHVGTPGLHALASAVLFFNNDGPHSLPLFFLSPFLQRKRKKKTEANSAGSNTSLGLTSFVLTMYAIGPSRLVR